MNPTGVSRLALMETTERKTRRVEFSLERDGALLTTEISVGAGTSQLQTGPSLYFLGMSAMFGFNWISKQESFKPRAWASRVEAVLCVFALVR